MQKSTLEILKNFSGINNGILIKSGNMLRTVSSAKNLFAVAKIDDNFPKEFAIFDLNQFLATVSLFDNPEISYHKDHLLIRKDTSKIKYMYSSASTVLAAPEKDISFKNPDLRFVLTKNHFSQLIKSSSVLEFDTLEFNADGVTAYNSKVKNENRYTFTPDSMEKSEGVKASYRIRIDLLKMIPGDYEVRVSEQAVHFKNPSMKLDYFVAVDA